MASSGTFVFSILKIVVQYLDTNKLFDKIKTLCDHMDNSESTVFIFPIDVNLHDIFEKSAYLGEKILMSPIESSALFHEVVFEYICCQNLLPLDVSSSQVLAKLCITDLPCKRFQIHNLSDLMKHSNHKGLVKLTGFVTGMSGMTKYTQSVKYRCSRSSCDGHFGNHFVRIHIPGALETQTVRSDFICNFCGDLLEEVISSRTLSDKMIIEVMPIQLQGCQRREMLRKEVTQAVPVIVRDDLINAIEIGKSYVIVGICRSDYTEENVTVTLEANNVIPIECKPVLTGNVIECLPSSIASIYQGCDPQRWSFIYQMAIHFTGDIVPWNKMLKLRFLLLISLVLSPEKHKLHILAIGSETNPAFALMKFAQQFSRRSFPASVETPLDGKVSNTKYPPTPYFIQAGCLLLASGGLSSLGEIGMWKKPRLDELKTALTKNQVMIDLASKYTGCLSQMISFPLACQVWAVHNVSGTKCKTDDAGSDVFTGSSTGSLTKSVLDSFSIIAFLNDSLTVYNEDRELHCLDFMWGTYFSQDANIDRQPVITDTDYEKYISLASQMDPEMSVEAEVLLNSYYSASRMARTSGFSGSHIQPSALSSLTSLCVGIAKLQLHRVVIEMDAVLSIYLYEEYISARCGMSVLNVQPQPDALCHDIHTFLEMQTGIITRQFYHQLQQFCSRVVNGTNLASTSKYSFSSMETDFKEE